MEKQIKAEIESLQYERKRLMKQVVNRTCGKAARVKAIDRRIAELERRLNNG